MIHVWEPDSLKIDPKAKIIFSTNEKFLVKNAFLFSFNFLKKFYTNISPLLKNGDCSLVEPAGNELMIKTKPILNFSVGDFH